MADSLFQEVYQIPDGQRAGLREQITEGGFASFGPDALNSDLIGALQAEAGQQRSSAWECANNDTTEQQLWRSELGPIAHQLLSSEETLQLMQEVIGYSVVLSYEATCFTYYEGPQQFLGLHTDRPDTCDVTLIIYLHVAWPTQQQPGTGLQLLVFDPTAATDAEPIQLLPTRTNHIVIGHGSEFPHCRLPLSAGEKVYALTACFAKAMTSETLAELKQARYLQQLIDDGYTAWQNADLEIARTYFEQALQINNNDDRAWSGLGHTLWSNQEFESAQRAFTQAACIDSYNPAHWSNIGLCLRDLGSYAGAINMFQVALMVDAEYAAAINEWGNVLQDQGHYHESLQHYYRSLAIDPSRAVVHHNLGIAYKRLGEASLALDAFAAALQRDPNYAHSLEEVGILYAELGYQDEALSAFEQAGTPRAKTLAQQQ